MGILSRGRDTFTTQGQIIINILRNSRLMKRIVNEYIDSTPVRVNNIIIVIGNIYQYNTTHSPWVTIIITRMHTINFIDIKYEGV